MTQIERGTLAVQATAEPVAPILREVAEEFAASSVAKSIQLETAPIPAQTTVWADRDRLEQVLGNLVGNAVKFRPPGGSIRLEAEQGESVVLFAVKDTGPGIPPELAPHVFERYWKAKSNGAGLGLFIAQGIVRAHGGDIDVRSTPGRGATFVFSIPRAPTRSGAPPNSKAAARREGRGAPAVDRYPASDRPASEATDSRRAVGSTGLAA